MADEPQPPPALIVQHNHADFGYSYGVIGGTLHMHEGGRGPVYFVDPWRLRRR
jgi:hypothetical protein